MSPALGLAALVAITVVWGSTFVIVKDALDTIPPSLLLAVRFTLAALALSWTGIDRRAVVPALWLGLLAFAGFASRKAFEAGVEQGEPTHPFGCPGEDLQCHAPAHGVPRQRKPRRSGLQDAPGHARQAVGEAVVGDQHLPAGAQRCGQIGRAHV